MSLVLSLYALPVPGSNQIELEDEVMVQGLMPSEGKLFHG